MLDELVSGRKKKRKARQAPASHKSSQIVHCQPLLSAAKPTTFRVVSECSLELIGR
jgi:hypothetical protein